eukprot:14549201-Ditylum_brightwellii.AAC.1
MRQCKNGITAKMQVEDNYHISISKNMVCLWNKGSGKEVPKKHCNKICYLDFYNTHMKDLREAFEKGIFELQDKKGVDFGVHTISALSPSKQESMKVVKLLWTNYQTCERFYSGWSLIERHVTIKKKGCPCKNSTKPNAE